jgi:hypothetical protein
MKVSQIRNKMPLVLLVFAASRTTAFVPSTTRAIRHPQSSNVLWRVSKRHNDVREAIENSSQSRILGSQLHSTASIFTGLKSLHSNNNYVLAVILWLSTFGQSLEQRTLIGKALSAPLATMALALIIANVGLLPFQSPICKLLFKCRKTSIFIILNF